MEKLKESIACYNCGSNENSLRYSHDGWNVVNCNSCGFVFTNPRPTLESLPSYYDQNYFDSGRFNHTGQGKFPSRLRDIYRYKKSGSILEIGCAQGHFLHYMSRLGWTVEGVEISQDGCEHIRKTYQWPVFNGDFLEFESDKKFDVICMYHVLEHVPEPLKVIEKAKAMLKENGIMVIEVPNINGFDMKNPERRKWSYDLPVHLTHYTPAILKQLLRKFGYSILYVDRYYPQFLLNYFNKKRTPQKVNAKVEHQKHNHVGVDTTPLNANIELPNKSMKSKFVNAVLFYVGTIFPGWRFTIIAKK